MNNALSRFGFVSDLIVNLCQISRINQQIENTFWSCTDHHLNLSTYQNQHLSILKSLSFFDFVLKFKQNTLMRLNASTSIYVCLGCFGLFRIQFYKNSVLVPRDFFNTFKNYIKFFKVHGGICG